MSLPCHILVSYFLFVFPDSDNKGVNSGRLVACITTLFLFSKIRPQLMVKHAMTMQPYLTTKCSVSIELSYFSFLYKSCISILNLEFTLCHSHFHWQMIVIFTDRSTVSCTQGHVLIFVTNYLQTLFFWCTINKVQAPLLFKLLKPNPQYMLDKCWNCYNLKGEWGKSSCHWEIYCFWILNLCFICRF